MRLYETVLFVFFFVRLYNAVSVRFAKCIKCSKFIKVVNKRKIILTLTETFLRAYFMPVNDRKPLCFLVEASFQSVFSICFLHPLMTAHCHLYNYIYDFPSL